MATKSTVRTRIAPSPTGFAHVGIAYMTLFNWAFARQSRGEFIIRLEDTDVKRHVEGAEEAIYSNLAWLGLDWDEGPDKGGPFAPYRQSERLDLYKEYAGRLLKKDLAYEEEGAIRFKNPGKSITWEDAVRGKISFPAEEVGNFVIIKSDGYPTYHLAVVVDDIEMKITHVIRGEEHISNTPKHIALFRAFDKNLPRFAHLPTLRNKDHKKLSKRRDPVDLGLYRKQGYLPGALVNFLCLLGWSHPEGKEVFDLNEFAQTFDLDRVRGAGPVFDTAKLDWLNGVYIRQMEDKTLAGLINEHVSADTDVAFLEKVVPLIKERISKLSEAESLLSFFWERPQIGKGLFTNEESAHHIVAAERALGPLEDWNLNKINDALSQEVEKESFRTGDFYMSLRLAIAGSRITPPINESMEILGKDEVLYRLKQIEKFWLREYGKICS